MQESKKCEGVSARVMRGCEEVRGNVSEIVRKTEMQREKERRREKERDRRT